MSPSESQRELRDKFLQAMLGATLALQQGGLDPEVTLEALIGATEQLKLRFEQELEELRQEEAD